LFACGSRSALDIAPGEVADGAGGRDASIPTDATLAQDAIADVVRARDAIEERFDDATADVAPASDATEDRVDGALCAQPLTACGSLCVDLSSDPNHCGACDTVCEGSPPDCVDRVCRLPGVAASVFRSCFLSTDGRVKCWGENDRGQLGQGDTRPRGGAPGELGSNLPPVNLGTGRTAVQLAAGVNHTCALLDHQSVKCWGDNASGQLGLGDANRRGDAPGEMGDALNAVDLGTNGQVTEIVAGASHTCVLLIGGVIKCWGYNVAGELGLGDDVSRGSLPGDMGDTLPTVSLGTGRSVVHVATGGDATCALLDHGALKCWGGNADGRLGLGDSNDRGLHPDEMGDHLPTVDLGTGAVITAVAMGSNHTCAILATGAVKCWGSNFSGQLGLGDQMTRGARAGDMGDNLPPLELGTGRTARKIAAGDEHTCALLDDDTMKCWGNNVAGQLGLGDRNDRGYGSGTMGDALATVNVGTGHHAVQIAAGAAHTCALLENGAVKCWGHNTYGALGTGDTKDRGGAPGEMGDALLAVPVF
jgi:alpha-tubulin suppressor-like RCC1 family protein